MHKETSISWREKKIKFKDFNYNENEDAFICKNGVTLHFNRHQEEITATGYARKINIYTLLKGSCKGCSFHAKCTKSTDRSLQVRWNAEQLNQQTRENLNSEEGVELRKRRGNEVESVFGDTKLNNRKRRYYLRGTIKVNLEAGLYYISHNLKKIHKVLTTKEPTENNFQTQGEQKTHDTKYYNFYASIAQQKILFRQNPPVRE